MAKLDQLDPRWIVELRPDHNNPNNWHWVEKDATGWSNTKIKQLLGKVVVGDERLGQCRIKEVTEVSGDVTANNRKGKLIFLIDLKIKANWEGRINGDDTIYKGELEIPEFDDVNIDSCTIDVSVKATTEPAMILKEVMRTKGIEAVREQLNEYLRLLREEYSQNLILPTAKDALKKQQQATSASKPENKTETTVKPSNQPVKIDTTTIKFEETFRCPASQLYMALTDEPSMKALCSGEAVSDPRPGGTFSLYGGAIHGEFVKLEPFHCIVERWRLRSWGNDGHFSEVTMKITEHGSGDTVLKLTQTGVPSKYVEETKNGWHQNFFERLKAVHGLGALLM